MLPKAHLTSNSRMSGSRWVIIPSWLSGPLRPFLYSSSVYSCHLFLSCSSSHALMLLGMAKIYFHCSILSWKANTINIYMISSHRSLREISKLINSELNIDFFSPKIFCHWYIPFQETTTINTLTQTGMYTHTHTVSQTEMCICILNYNIFPISDIFCNLLMDPISSPKSSGSLLYSVFTLTMLVQWSPCPGPVEEPLNWAPFFHGSLSILYTIPKDIF